jgi:hypothetical protein
VFEHIKNKREKLELVADAVEIERMKLAIRKYQTGHQEKGYSVSGK